MNDMMEMIMLSAVRHGLTAVAGVFVTHGALAASDEAKFIQMGSGIIIWGVGFAWSWWQKAGHAKVVAELKQLKGAK